MDTGHLRKRAWVLGGRWSLRINREASKILTLTQHNLSMSKTAGPICETGNFSQSNHYSFDHSISWSSPDPAQCHPPNSCSSPAERKSSGRSVKEENRCWLEPATSFREQSRSHSNALLSPSPSSLVLDSTFH